MCVCVCVCVCVSLTTLEAMLIYSTKNGQQNGFILKNKFISKFISRAKCSTVGIECMNKTQEYNYTAAKL